MNLKLACAGLFFATTLIAAVPSQYDSAAQAIPMASVKLVEEKVMGDGPGINGNHWERRERRWERRERRWERRERRWERRERWHRWIRH
jgi:hypothetical protein